MGKLWGNKIFVVGGSLIVLLALGVVLGLAIIRIQNPTPTVTRPKAVDMSTFDKTKRWPACAPGGSEPSCCKNIANGGGYDKCGWPERGWCSEEQCNGSASTKGDPNKSSCGVNSAYKCSRNGEIKCSSDSECKNAGAGLCVEVYRPGCMCGLYTFNADYCKPPPSCSLGKGTQPFPAVWQENVPTKLTLKWMASPSTGGDGGAPYTSIYLWSCKARSDDCMVYGSAGSPDFDNINVASLYKPTGKGQNFAAGEWQAAPADYYVKSLKPNTQYWWAVTPGISGCGVQMYADTWTFTTGSGSTTCSGTTPDLCGSTCTDTKTDKNNCGMCGRACFSDTQICQNGNCVAGSVTANECEVCGGGNAKSCGTGLKCSGTSSTVGVCIKNDGTTSCGTCASDNDCLLKALVCVSGSCVDPASAHLGCGTNSTCVRKSGSGSNTDGCTSVGGTCGGQSCTDSLAAPIIANPSDNASNVNVRPTLSWTPATGTCPTNPSYTVALGLASTNTAPVIETCRDISSTSCQLSTDLSSGTAYIWNVSIKRVGSPDYPSFTSSWGHFTTTGTANEVNSCWGNGGANGKCYDCNGDGEVNILDFACFRAKYLQNVQ